MSRAIFYNAAPRAKDRPTSQVNRELGGLVREYRPRVLVVAEAVTHPGLEPIPGYAMARDRTRAGRANMVAYYREDCDHRRTWWADMHETWTRTEHPGTHPARSIVALSLGTVQVLGAHQPPLFTDNTHRAQLEQIDALSTIMAPWRWRPNPVGFDNPTSMARPRLLLWDPNHEPDDREGPSPWYLAHRIGGEHFGGKTDGAVTRGHLLVRDSTIVDHAGGVRLETDHPGAFVMDLRLAGKGTW